MSINITHGQIGYFKNEINIPDVDMKRTIDSIVSKVNNYFGYIVLSSVSPDIISNILNQIATNRKNIIVGHTNTNIFQDMLNDVIEIISSDAIAHEIDISSYNNHSIWNSVGKQTPDSLKAINTKVNLINPTFDEANMRF